MLLYVADVYRRIVDARPGQWPLHRNGQEDWLGGHSVREPEPDDSERHHHSRQVGRGNRTVLVKIECVPKTVAGYIRELVVTNLDERIGWCCERLLSKSALRHP